MVLGSQKRQTGSREPHILAPAETLADLLDAETLLQARVHFRNELLAIRASRIADRTTQARRAHALISSAAVLGFSHLSRACADVEMALGSALFDARYANMQMHVEAALQALAKDQGASE